MIKKYHVSKNLFNKSTALANKAISDSSGNTFNYNGLNASDYINVSGMAKVSITATGASRWGAFYDTNKGFISGFNGYGTINVPQNAVYMRITVTDAFLDSCMVNEGTTLLPYEPFVSDNLFNEIYPNIDSSLHYTAIYVGDGQFTMSTTCPRNQSGACLFFLAGNVSSGASTESNGVWGYSGTSYGTITRTQTAVNGYVTIAYRSLTTDLNPVNEDTMVNIGSTAKPYTPYGTAWIDIPYRKYGTETETFSTLPHEVIGDGTAISAWSMKGNMQQSGTPTPSNPIYPTEVGEKTANLLNISQPITSAGNRYIYNGDFAFNGEAVTFKANFYCSLAMVDNNDTEIVNRALTANTSLTVSTPNGIKSLRVYTPNAISEGYVMINEGTEAIPYEPYGQYKIPISFNGVTYPVYLGNVQTTRKIVQLVLDGTEQWGNAGSGDSKYYQYTLGALNTAITGLVLSSHFVSATITTTSTDVGARVYNSTSIGISALNIRPQNVATELDTDTKFKQWLADQYAAGTPVKIWYVLTNATTGIVNEPIRKMGDYADELTSTQAGVTIPTTGTAESFDVDTTLKPSEVSLTYHGWHEHSDTKFTT